jgi:cobalt-zinc-cadmium efflux system membrane fusion protein
MPTFNPQPKTFSQCIAALTVLMFMFNAPAVVLAGAGHDHSGASEFQGGGANSGSVRVDAATAKRLGIKTEAVKRQTLALGIKTTGQIETLPSQKVQVTPPIAGKVVELLVEPGAKVRKGQVVAVLSSPDLIDLRVGSQEKRTEAIADLQQAQADLKLALQNRERYQQIANAEIAQAQSQAAFAQEKYTKDMQLASAGALPRRNALESQTQLAEAKAKLTTASSRRDVIEADAQVTRAQSALFSAQTRLKLSEAIYQTRLQQLGTAGNSKGLVTVTAPLTGTVADRPVTLGETVTVEAGSKSLMTIVNDSGVFATANIYEKDLDKVKVGQPIKVKVASVPNQTFTGRISQVGTAVTGETRVVPVQAIVENSSGKLKPGMFADLEILTGQQSASVVAVPTSAIVDANGRKTVYAQNGNAFQAVDVELGETSFDLVEVKNGLFEGDIVVTQRAPQLHAQSLRGDNTTSEDVHSEEGQGQETKAKINGLQLPSWLMAGGGGGAIATVAFLGGILWSNRRQKDRVVLVGNSEFEAYEPKDLEKEIYIDNHKSSILLSSTKQDENQNREKV